MVESGLYVCTISMSESTSVSVLHADDTTLYALPVTGFISGLDANIVFIVGGPDLCSDKIRLYSSCLVFSKSTIRCCTLLFLGLTSILYQSGKKVFRDTTLLSINFIMMVCTMCLFDVLAAAWENGTLSELEDTSRVISLTRLTPRIEQYLQDIENAADKGFDSIFDEFDHATNAYKTAEQQQVTMLK